MNRSANVIRGNICWPVSSCEAVGCLTQRPDIEIRDLLSSGFILPASGWRSLQWRRAASARAPVSRRHCQSTFHERAKSHWRKTSRGSQKGSFMGH